MQRALSLAERGRERVHPNPLVGCVIVKKGRIIAEGYHAYYGGPHAEIVALRKAGKKAQGATLYVTLEPCSHWGKTPPCAPEIIKSGLKKAVIAMKDPNPLVSGRGIKALKAHGLNVYIGDGQDKAKELNRSFITNMTQKRPTIIIKAATTLDGKIATAGGVSQWISSPASRRLVHHLRSQADAVLIGANTACLDNPSLTSHGQGKNPLRIVLDPTLRCPVTLRMFNDQKAPTLVVTGPKTSPKKALILQKKGVQILRTSLKFGKFELITLVNYLFKINVNQLFIEGGGETIWGFINARLVDEVYWFIAPLLLGGRSAKTSVEGEGFTRLSQALKLRTWKTRTLGPDILIWGSV